MHSLPELPYPVDALGPLMSAETLRYHHGKHHRSYVKKLNELVQNTPFDGKNLEETVRTSSGTLFDNAAQHYNHSFFWHCLRPGGAEDPGPTNDLLRDIVARWGSLSLFKEDFGKKAKELFGSGWCWLSVDAEGALEILPLENAGTPIATGGVPLLTLDVWEHAYYLDHRNSRKAYLEAFWKLADWDRVAARYRQRRSTAPASLP